MGRMIDFDLDDVRFNYRVCAVCVHQGHVLLHRSELDPFWVLPGGRPMTLETAREATRREVREEMGEEAEVGRLLWVLENFFTYGERRFHELSFIFDVTLQADSPWLKLDETFTMFDSDPLGRSVRLEFRWFPQDALGAMDLRPSFLNEGLRQLPETPQHVVHHGR
jgi:ADP-ribose pyrophosphatase YjhB (NUDIX family)